MMIYPSCPKCNSELYPTEGVFLKCDKCSDTYVSDAYGKVMLIGDIKMNKPGWVIHLKRENLLQWFSILLIGIILCAESQGRVVNNSVLYSSLKDINASMKEIESIKEELLNKKDKEFIERKEIMKSCIKGRSH